MNMLLYMVKDLCRIVSSSLMWKLEFVRDILGYLDEVIYKQSVEDTGTKGLVSAFKELRGLWRNGGEYNVRDTWKVIRALWVRVNGLSGQMGVVR